jgi:hypothetical protein
MSDTPAIIARGLPGNRVDAHRAGITITLRMTAGDSISAADRDLMKRLTIVLAFVFVFTAAFSHLLDVYSHKFFDRTEPARWIWANQSMSANDPLAFFAAREIDLPPNRVYTRLKILGDPEYTLYLNGREVAGRRLEEESDRTLDYYDLSDLVRTGRNRIVIAVRAPQGVGGLLASIDIAPETENWIVTDAQWKIYRAWDPLILEYDIAGQSERPMIVGAPPIGRWNYLPIEKRARATPPTKVIEPKTTFFVDGRLPAISTRGGIAVAVANPAKATAFDFGHAEGRIRVSIDHERGFSRVVPMRFANLRDELGLVEWHIRPIVFAPGEREVTTPEEHGFRYALAFARDVRVGVVQ